MTNDLERINGLLGQKGSRVTWLFAGDSITHGAFHTHGARDYVEHFAERIRYELGRYFDTVVTTACSGWTVQNIKNELDWAILRHRPTIVSINVGMNDAKSTSPEDFRRDLVQVVETIRSTTNAALILHTPVRIHKKLDEQRPLRLEGIASVIRQLAEQTGAVLIDHDQHWAAAETEGRLPFWLGDAIHPNAVGHVVMAHLLLKQLGLWDDKSNVCRLFAP